MKAMKRVCVLKILCLVSVLILGGCSKPKEQEIYYKTIDIGMELGITRLSNSVLMENNKILLDTYIGEERAFVVLDGELNVEDIKPVISQVEAYEIHEACKGSEDGHTYSNKIAYKSDQEIVNLTVNYIDNHDTVDLYFEIYNPDLNKMSNSKKVNLPLKGRERYLDFKVDTQGNYYLVQADGKVEIRDANLNIQQQFIDGFYTEVINIDPNTMGLIKVGQDAEIVIEHIDNKTFEITESYQVPHMLNAITYNERNIVGMLGNKFMAYNRTTQELKEIVDLLDYFDVKNVLSTIQLEDNYYLSMFYNEENSLELRGFIPTKKDESQKLDRGSIRLGTIHTGWADQLTREIKRNNPSIEVKATAHEGMGSNEWNNFINTELLSGNGEDMYAELSSWDSIVTNQLVYDMKPFIEELVKGNPNDYQQNLIKAITTEEGIYVLPEDIKLPVVVMDKEIADAYHLYEVHEEWTWDEFIDILRTIQVGLEDGRTLLGDSESMQIIQAYLVGENLTLENKDIAQEKNKIQEILSMGLELKSFEGGEGTAPFLGGGLEQPELAKQVMNDTVVAIKYVYNYDIYAEVNEKYAILKLPKNNRDWFISGGSIVNNESQAIDLTMKVISDLYVQGTKRSENAQFTIYNVYMKEQKTNHEKGSVYDKELDKTTECRKIDQRSLDTIEEVYNSANKWISYDGYNWCRSEITKCLDKEITPEKAADVIINKALLYQKE